MGESKHTPGPWIIKYSGNGYPYQLDAPNGSRGPGVIRSVTRWGAFSFPSSPEALANARLIAAAPELLEALKWLHELCIHANPGAFDNGNLDATGSIDEGDVLASELIRGAQSAIAKAEGRT